MWRTGYSVDMCFFFCGWAIGCLDCCVRGCTQSLQANAGTRHSRFLPSPFEFIILESSCRCLNDSVGKLKNLNCITNRNRIQLCTLHSVVVVVVVVVVVAAAAFIFIIIIIIIIHWALHTNKCTNCISYISLQLFTLKHLMCSYISKEDVPTWCKQFDFIS